MKIFNPLYYKMLTRKIKGKQIAEYLNCTPPTFSRKLKGLYEFTAYDIRKIAEYMKLSNDEIIEIWFSQN